VAPLRLFCGGTKVVRVKRAVVGILPA